MALILSRKVGEKLVIRKDIIVTVNRVQGNRVTIGVDAPRDVPVHRREVYDAIHGQAAAGGTDANERAV